MWLQPILSYYNVLIIDWIKLKHFSSKWTISKILYWMNILKHFFEIHCEDIGARIPIENDLFSFLYTKYLWPLTVFFFFYSDKSYEQKWKQIKTKKFVFLHKKRDRVEKRTIKCNRENFAFNVFWNLRIWFNGKQIWGTKNLTNKKHSKHIEIYRCSPVCPVVDNDATFQNRCDSGRCSITA